jgi:exonuclease III
MAKHLKAHSVKRLRLASWSVDGVRGRKMEMYHYLGKRGVDICLLTENHLRSGKVFRIANYVCHRTDRPTEGGGTVILVRRGIDHYAIPVPGLSQ